MRSEFEFHIRRLSILSRFLIISFVILFGGAAMHPAWAAIFPYSTYLWVWGENEAGELGNNGSVNVNRPQLTFGLPSGTLITALSAGNNAGLLGTHSLAMDRNGNVWGWGYNLFGQVGNGTGGTNVFAPAPVCGPAQTAPCAQSLGSVVAIAAGGLHSEALDTFSNVFGWGFNQFGEVGYDGGTTSIPVRNNALFAQLHQLPGPPTIKAIAAGGHHGLALDSRGIVWAWGGSEFGQLGLGNFDAVNVFALPITFPAGTIITAIAAGAYHSLALDSDGNVWAWGENDTGQLGLSSPDNAFNTPTKLLFFPPNTHIKAISAGAQHSLALDTTGKVFAWGANFFGQLGNGQTIEQDSPVQTIFPDGTPQILTIGAGGYHNLAIDANHNLWSWGRNGQGQLGNETFTSSSVPIRPTLPGGTRIIGIAAGGFHSLAIESRSFLYGLEAVLDLNAVTSQARLLPQSFTNVSITVTTSVLNLNPAGNKQLVTSTLTDAAGNKLALAVNQQQNAANSLSLQIQSLQYNDGATVTPPPNLIDSHWQMDTAGTITLLQQHLMLDSRSGTLNITTHYDANLNQTVIDVQTPANGPQHLVENGLVRIQASTVNGNLAFSDGTQVWP